MGCVRVVFLGYVGVVGWVDFGVGCWFGGGC